MGCHGRNLFLQMTVSRLISTFVWGQARLRGHPLSGRVGGGGRRRLVSVCSARSRRRSAFTPYTLRPTPCTLRPTPYALRPTPYTLHPTPYVLHPTPYALRPTPYVLRPTPHTLRPKPHTPHPTPCTLHPTPHTLHPQPSCLNAGSRAHERRRDARTRASNLARTAPIPDRSSPQI